VKPTEDRRTVDDRADGKILLILDLDETLIHAAERPFPRAADFRVGPYWVFKRPGLDAFLCGVAGLFRLAVWSSASPDYVEAVASRILPSGVVPEFVWARDRCVLRFDPETYLSSPIKDLKKVRRAGYDLSRTLIVDDTPAKVARNYGNAIYVRPYEADDDGADRELPLLLRYLATLAALPP
jgi:RNA polymerase II subunit A small phosphatase-like protein